MNKKILLALLTSFIGNHFYILFVTLILLQLGYSATFVASSLALTILPNLLFGPKLGRLVDQSNKKKLHSILCVALAIIVNLISYVALNVSADIAQYLIILLMILYNCLLSPLNTILYQYIVPNMGENETKSFIVWERYEAFGIFIASIIGFTMMKFDLVSYLLPLDSISFSICAFIIHKHWNYNHVNESASIKKEELKECSGHLDKISSLLIKSFDKNILFISITSVLIYVIAVDSHTYNLGILFFKELNFKASYIPLIMSSLALFNILGSHIFERFFINTDDKKVHHNMLIATMISLFIISISIKTQAPAITLFGLVLLQLIEPVWSTTNNVLLRSQVDKNKLGEFFGYFRVIRSLSTFLGIGLYGLSQQQGELGLFIMVGVLLFIVPILFKNYKPSTKNIITKEKNYEV